MIPTDADAAVPEPPFTGGVEEAARDLYARHRRNSPDLPRPLGRGGNRIVYPLGNLVLKVERYPINPKVLYSESRPSYSNAVSHSNADEIRVWVEAPPAIRKHLVPIVTWAPDAAWVVMDRVTPGGTASDEVLDLFTRCGVEDLFAANIAEDGRILDYGMLDLAAWAQCSDEGEAMSTNEAMYTSRRDLPPAIKSLSLPQANYWSRVFDAVKDKDGDAQKAARIAWMQTRRKFPKAPQAEAMSTEPDWIEPARLNALAKSFVEAMGGAEDGWRREGVYDRGAVLRWAAENGLTWVGMGHYRAVFAWGPLAPYKWPHPQHAVAVVKFDLPHTVWARNEVLKGTDVRGNAAEIDVWQHAPADLREHLTPLLAWAPDAAWVVMPYIENVGGQVPFDVRKRLEKCGVRDLVSPENVAASGKIIDYGVLNIEQWKACSTPTEALGVTDAYRAIPKPIRDFSERTSPGRVLISTLQGEDVAERFAPELVEHRDRLFQRVTGREAPRLPWRGDTSEALSTELAWLPLETVLALIPAAEANGVSDVARSKRGFVSAYERAKGKPDRLGVDQHSEQDWRARRNAFVARHRAQAEAEGYWRDGAPTRRHLALAMWAWSPTPERLLKWAQQAPSEAMSTSSSRLVEVATAWAKHGTKVYDNELPIMLPIEEVERVREYQWSRGHARRRPAEWDELVESMRFGWNPREPAHLQVGKDGRAKLGEGNHRLSISRLLGFREVPVWVHFYQSVPDGKLIVEKSEALRTESSGSAAAEVWIRDALRGTR